MALGDAINLLLHRAGVGVDVECDQVTLATELYPYPYPPLIGHRTGSSDTQFGMMPRGSPGFRLTKSKLRSLLCR